METGMDDYTGMRTIEEKDGKSHFQLEEKGEKKKKMISGSEGTWCTRKRRKRPSFVFVLVFNLFPLANWVAGGFIFYDVEFYRDILFIG